MPKLAIAKLNALIDAINAAASDNNTLIKLLNTQLPGAEAGTYKTIYDVIEDITSGSLATYLKLTGLDEDYLDEELSAIEEALGDKVDKDGDKVLSDNNYTDNEKTKLGGIAAGADVNVQPDWNQSTSGADDFIKNKPNVGATDDAAAVDGSIYARINYNKGRQDTANTAIGAATDEASASGSLYARIKHNYNTIITNKNAIGDEDTSGKILYRIKAIETRATTLEGEMDAAQAILESRQHPIAVDSTEYLSKWLQGISGYTVTQGGETLTPSDLITGTVILVRAAQEPDFWWDGGITTAGTVTVDDTSYVSTASADGSVIGGVRELEYNYSEVDAAVTDAQTAKADAEAAQTAAETARDNAHKWADGTDAISTDPQYHNNAKYHADSAAASAAAALLSQQTASAAVATLYCNTHHYTARWNKSEATMTRLNDAANITTTITNFAHRGSVNANYENPFDDIYPWSGRRLCNIDVTRYRALTSGHSITECVKAWEGDTDFSYSDTNGVWVYTPEFWGKSWDDGTYRYFDVADKATGGHVYYPESIEGRWHGRTATITIGDAAKTCLVPTVGMPAKSIAMSTLHTYAKNWGATLDSIFSIDAYNAVADKIRAERNRLLAATDWTQVADNTLTAEQRAAWASYRQALRDIPEQNGFPYNVVFPTKGQ